MHTSSANIYLSLNLRIKVVVFTSINAVVMAIIAMRAWINRISV
jgi:hypothetical protein